MAKALIVSIFADAKQFTAELDRAASKTRSMGKVAGVAGLAIAGGLAYGLEKSVKAASQMQTTTATMDTAFHAAGVNVGRWSGKIDQAEAKGRNLGFTNIDVRESLGTLVTATQDGGKALTDMGVAEDLARKKHISLSDSTKILSSAMAGSTRAARQLGISVAAVHDQSTLASIAYGKAKKAIDAQFPSTSKMTVAQNQQKTAMLGALQVKYAHIKADAALKDKQSTAAQVISVVTQRVKGQAKAFSDTAAGGAARFHAQMEALQENLGTALLPALNKIVSVLATVAAWLAKHTTIAKALVIGLVILATTMTAAGIAAKVSAAYTTLFGAAEGEASLASGVLAAAMDAIPIIAVAAAFAFAAYEIYKHWGAVKGFFVKVWDGVKAIFSTSINWLKGHWKLFLGLPGLVWQYWGAITGFLGGMWNDVKGLFNSSINWVKSHWMLFLGLPGFVVKYWGTISGWFGTLWDGITGTFTSAIGFLKSAWSGFVGWLTEMIRPLVDAYNAVAGWATGNINLPHAGSAVAKHARGGLFSKPHLGIVAESGPELILPLRDHARTARLLHDTFGITMHGGNGLVSTPTRGHVTGSGEFMLVAEVPINIHMSDGRVLRENQRVTLRAQRRGHNPTGSRVEP